MLVLLKRNGVEMFFFSWSLIYVSGQNVGKPNVSDRHLGWCRNHPT